VVGLIVLVLAAPTFAGEKSWWGKNEKGSGELTTETRDIEAFTSVEASGAFDIEITVGKQQSVSLTFDDNLMDNIITEVRHGRLLLETEGSYSSRKACVVTITVPSLESFESTGSGDARIDFIDSKTFECRLSGSGSINAVGKVDELDLEIAGSGDIDARELKARDVYATISGSGDIDVYAMESISGRVSGSGDIFYYGEPKRTSLKVSGSGTISRR
jgi:hypothetical protein